MDWIYTKILLYFYKISITAPNDDVGLTRRKSEASEIGFVLVTPAVKRLGGPEESRKRVDSGVGCARCGIHIDDRPKARRKTYLKR